MWWLSGFLMGFGTALMIVGLGGAIVRRWRSTVL
jgi:hypothetical protein